MPNCRSSSPGSAPCRLELQWRPSRWLLAALLILSVLYLPDGLGSLRRETLRGWFARGGRDG